MNAMRPQKLCCRPIAETDIAAIIPLLVRSFPARSAAYWSRAFDQLAKRPVLEDLPRFGYVLASGEQPVGVVLLIFTSLKAGDRSIIRCNLSSWCVEHEFSAYSSILINTALKQRDRITYLNVSPAHHTWRTIVAQGFSCYCLGNNIVFAALSLLNDRSEVRAFDRNSDYGGKLREDEFNLLADHAAYGCMSMTCLQGGATYPFVFIPRDIRIGPFRLPAAQLCYCRDIEEFRRFAGPIGRALAKQGRLFVLVDANGPMPGLPGWYFPDRGRKYFRGPNPPRLGDLSYTEAVLFGA